MTRKTCAGGLLVLAALLVPGILPLMACRRPEPPARDTAAPREADLQAIKILRDAFVKAHNDGDADRLAELFTDDAILIPADDATCEGREEIADYLQGVLEESPSSLEFEVKETKVLGDWAFERIDATVVVPDPVTREEWEVWARYLWVLKRQPGGQWRIARLITNIDESGDEEPDGEVQPQT
jgi:uncharacterized protein (TIGR02246 family)